MMFLQTCRPSYTAFGRIVEEKSCRRIYCKKKRIDALCSCGRVSRQQISSSQWVSDDVITETSVQLITRSTCPTEHHSPASTIHVVFVVGSDAAAVRSIIDDADEHLLSVKCTVLFAQKRNGCSTRP